LPTKDPHFFARTTTASDDGQEYDYANNQVTTVMNVTELPRLGGLKADTDFLSVKDFFEVARNLQPEDDAKNRHHDRKSKRPSHKSG